MNSMVLAGINAQSPAVSSAGGNRAVTSTEIRSPLVDRIVKSTRSDHVSGLQPHLVPNRATSIYS